MDISKIKEGDTVILRNGDEYEVRRSGISNKLFILLDESKGDYLMIDDYSDNGINNAGFREFKGKIKFMNDERYDIVHIDHKAEEKVPEQNIVNISVSLDVNINLDYLNK